MNQNSSQHDCEHIRDLRLAYLEDLLDPEERQQVEEHLHDCPRCTAELQEVARWANILEEQKEVFCPEPWELFDHVRGEIPRTDLAAHLETCQACRENEEAFRTALSEQAMPEALWRRIASLAQERSTPEPVHGWSEMISDLLARVSDLFRVPVLAAATAVAAILLLVLIYPARQTQPLVALSSVRWEASFLERQVMGGPPSEAPAEIRPGKKERLAVMLLLAGLKDPLPQQEIDALYTELKPAPEVRKRFDVLTPEQVKEAVVSGKIGTGSTADLLKGLHEALGVSKVALVTVSERAGRFSVQAELTDAVKGTPGSKVVLTDVVENDLPLKINQAVSSVLTH